MNNNILLSHLNCFYSMIRFESDSVEVHIQMIQLSSRLKCLWCGFLRLTSTTFESSLDLLFVERHQGCGYKLSKQFNYHYHSIIYSY